MMRDMNDAPADWVETTDKFPKGRRYFRYFERTIGNKTYFERAARPEYADLPSTLEYAPIEQIDEYYAFTKQSP